VCPVLQAHCDSHDQPNNLSRLFLPFELTVAGNRQHSMLFSKKELTMLVLSRKTQQQLVIPGLDIRITVLSVGTNRVQLGIEAPQEIQVARGELNRQPPRGETVRSAAP
jgi:carbon storage regulator CsrA